MDSIQERLDSIEYLEKEYSPSCGSEKEYALARMVEELVWAIKAQQQEIETMKRDIGNMQMHIEWLEKDQ